MIYDLLKGLDRVTDKCYEIFAPYYEQRAKHYLYPVFYQSVTQMIAESGFYYKIFINHGRNTLAIFKRSTIMGNNSVIMQIAPISLQGNKSDELIIMKLCNKNGITIKLGAEDIRMYNIPKNMIEQIRGNIEYLYNVKECYECKGGKFHSFRRAANRVMKLDGYFHLLGFSKDIESLVKKWDKRNKTLNSLNSKKKCSQLQEWKRISHIKNDRMTIHSVYIGDVLEVFSVVEKITSRHYIFVMGMRKYDSTINDVNACIHRLDCEIGYNPNMNGVYANLGASLGIKGLSEAKEKLKPCAHQQIYKLRSITKLNYEIIKSLFK